MSPTPAHHLLAPLRRLLAPLLSPEPAAQLIRSTARQQWRLLAVNQGISVVEALSEGATLAVLLQGLQSLSLLAYNVSVGYVAAECRAKVTALIHSQVLRLSFPCASGTKVGDLTDDASQGPEAIRSQIEQSGQLLAVALMGAAPSGLDQPGLASP